MYAGRDTVDFLEDALHQNIAEELNIDDDASTQVKIERAFLMADAECRMAGIETSGATVVVCLIKVRVDFFLNNIVSSKSKNHLMK